MRTRKGRKVERLRTHVVIDLDEVRKQVNRAYNLPDSFELQTFTLADTEELSKEINFLEKAQHMLDLMIRNTGRRC